MRMEPPPSLACAAATRPAATAAAEPPLEPPGERDGSHGFLVAPKASGSVVGQDPELGGVGLAEEDEARLAEAPREVAVLLLDPAHLAQEAHALVHRVAGRVGAQVLEQERHAAEGPVGQVAGRRLARLVEQRRDHRVELGVQPLDALDGLVDQLGRAGLAGPDELGLGGGVEAGGAHRRNLPLSAGRARRGSRASSASQASRSQPWRSRSGRRSASLVSVATTARGLGGVDAVAQGAQLVQALDRRGRGPCRGACGPRPSPRPRPRRWTRRRPARRSGHRSSRPPSGGSGRPAPASPRGSSLAMSRPTRAGTSLSGRSGRRARPPGPGLPPKLPVDGLGRDAGLAGDVGDRRGREPLRGEQPPGGVDDLAARLGRLAAPEWGVVGHEVLDSLSNID